jgi:hypothetical protein
MKITELGNIVYGAIIGECERMEAEKQYPRNGHHLAQKLTELITTAHKDFEEKTKPCHDCKFKKTTPYCGVGVKMANKRKKCRYKYSSRRLQMEKRLLEAK